MLSDPLQTPAWQLIFAAIGAAPAAERLARLAALRPDAGEVRAIAACHGVLPLVDRGLGPAREVLLAPAERERWRRAVAEVTLGCLVKQRELQRLLPLFAAAGIPVAALKGPVLAERLYGDALLRTFNDLDLLVPPDCVPAALALLEGEGYVANYQARTLPAGDGAAAGAYHCMLLHPVARWPIEIHWAVFYAWRRLRFSREALDGWFRAGGPAAEELLLYLCVHGTIHYWGKLKWVADVDRCARAAPGPDWERLAMLARARGCARALRLGLLLARTVCGLALPATVAAEMDADPAVADLARRVMRCWPPGAEFRRTFWWKVRYLCACRERPADRWEMLPAYALMRWRTAGVLARRQE